MPAGKIGESETFTTAEALKQIDPLAAKRHVMLENQIADSLVVPGDAVGLRELMVILLDNAIKYGGEGTTVRLILRRSGRNAVVSIEDEGPGVKPEDLPHIFDRFYRADSARHHSGAGGYGLGLSIAKAITQLHLGSIEAHNLPQRGAAFTVRIPLDPSGFWR